MNILIVTPAPPRTKTGNRVTALRWAGILRGLGHRVTTHTEYAAQACDLLIALHARRSGPSVARFHQRHPDRPVVVALTGTDVYGGLRDDGLSLRAIELAARLVVLQPLAAREVPRVHRDKVRVIYQSVRRPARGLVPRRETFDVCVVGHLRAVKDPFRTAEAARLLPEFSRIRVLHAGAALSEEMAERARREMEENRRYRWLGEVPRWKVMRLMGRSRLLALTSVMEGGANVLSEAIALSLPVVCSRIPGSVGLLGRDYPGYYRVGDTAALARLLNRAERDPIFLERLKTRIGSLAYVVRPSTERRSWAALIREIDPGRSAMVTRPRAEPPTCAARPERGTRRHSRGRR